MKDKLVEWYELITTVEFWESLLNSFQILGPLAPILLAAVESLVPALPLIAIVTLNVAAHGPFYGFVYSWVGTAVGCTLVFLFFRKVCKKFFVKFIEKHKNFKKAKEWVDRANYKVLFTIAIFPFTPSCFLNFAFGISDYNAKTYLYTIYAAKFVMILLLTIFGQSVVAAFENPVFIILALALVAVMYIFSKKVSKDNDLEEK